MTARAFLAFSSSSDAQGSVEYAVIIAVMAIIAIAVIAAVLFVVDRITGGTTDVLSWVLHAGIEWIVELVSALVVLLAIFPALGWTGGIGRAALKRRKFVGLVLLPLSAMVAVPVAVWSLPSDWILMVGLTGPVFPWLHDTFSWFPEPRIIDRSLLTVGGEAWILFGFAGLHTSPTEAGAEHIVEDALDIG